MATKGISPGIKKNPQGAMVLLSAAICEWVLIFLLFVDATFSYILRRFAEYCELPTPCLLCSRINALSGKKKFECYNALLCRSHREELSSLVSCHVHGNLTDVREMCEECFMSMHDKSNSGSSKGQLDLEIEQHRVQSFLLHKKISLAYSGPRICPCCNRTWGAKPNAHKFLELTPVGFGASKANVKPPLPRVPGRSRFSRRNSFKKHRDKLSAPVSPRSNGKSLSDALSPVGYSELKYDSESEAPCLGEEGIFAVRRRKDTNPAHDPHCVARTLLKLQTDDAVLEKQNNHAFAEVTSLLDQHVQLETHNSLPTHGLDELNWEQLHLRTNSPASPELLDDVVKAPSNESGDASITVEPQPQLLDALIPLKNTHPGSDDENQETLKSHDEDDYDIGSTNSSPMSDEGEGESTTPVELPPASGPINFEDIKSVLQQSAPNKDDSQNVGAFSPDANPLKNLNSLERTDSSFIFERVSSGDDITQAQQPPQCFSDGGAPYILNDTSSTKSSAMSDEGKEISNTSVELPSASGSTEFEDIKEVLQQSDPKQDDSQNADANQVQDLASLERNDFRLKFEERVSLSDEEVEGESSNEMLKSQIEHAKKCMNDLYKELEEERNAASVAANQAMAMITRLQEEKAALHMEALQYLRMMDEQAEYDMEALQKANDDLAEKEKELQDLEYELELYRNNIDVGSSVPDPHKESISTTGGNTTGDSRVHLNESSLCEPSSDISGNVKSSISNLDEEKLYLEEYLKQLERRIHEVSIISNDQATSEKEADGSHVQNGFNVVDETSSIDSPTHLIVDCDAHCEETNHNRSNMLNLSTSGREPNMASLEDEIANFKERLKAFEADREFIKHSLSALHNGNDGLEHIQQIIDQLQELRNREFKKTCVSAP